MKSALLRFLLLLVGLTGAAVEPAANELPPALRAPLDRVVGERVARGEVVGAAVGVVVGGRSFFVEYGHASRGGPRVTRRTLFEIGSNTKTFTALLLAQEVIAGRLSLFDTLATAWPERALHPRLRDATLFDLATFTAGLPDDPPGFARRSLEERDLRHYPKRDFFRFLEAWEPAHPPPAPWRYSNVSFGVLGYVLAPGGVPAWEGLLRERITGPLAMSDTVVRPAGEQLERYAQGYTGDGRAVPHWPVMAWAQAGALRSTTRDLVRYLAAYLGHSEQAGVAIPASIRRATPVATEGHFAIEARGRRFLQALGWRVRPGSPGRLDAIPLKGGATNGFKSFLGFDRERDVGLVILLNSARPEVEPMGLELIGRIHPERL